MESCGGIQFFPPRLPWRRALVNAARQGDHGQGTLFLRAFLAQLGRTVPEQELGRATVRDQVQTSFNRRLDLLIDVPGQLVLGLENKINAADQDRQVADYVEFVRFRSRAYGNWVFVFLTPDGASPSKQSIPPLDREREEKQHRFFCLSYRKGIHDWLQSCIGPCRAEIVRAFVTDMSAWVQTLNPVRPMEDLMADLAKELTVTFLLANPNYLKTALSVIDNSEFIRASLVAGFAEAVEEALRRNFKQDDGWEVRNTISAGLRAGKKGYTGIYLRRSPWPSECFVAITAEREVPSDLLAADLLYGVRGKGTCEGDLGHRLHEALKDMGRGKLDPPWNARWRVLPPLGGIPVSSWKQAPAIIAMHERRSDFIQHLVDLFEGVTAAARPILDPA